MVIAQGCLGSCSSEICFPSVQPSRLSEAIPQPWPKQSWLLFEPVVDLSGVQMMLALYTCTIQGQDQSGFHDPGRLDRRCRVRVLANNFWKDSVLLWDWSRSHGGNPAGDQECAMSAEGSCWPRAEPAYEKGHVIQSQLNCSGRPWDTFVSSHPDTSCLGSQIQSYRTYTGLPCISSSLVLVQAFFFFSLYFSHLEWKHSHVPMCVGSMWFFWFLSKLNLPCVTWLFLGRHGKNIYSPKQGTDDRLKKWFCPSLA